MDKKHFTDAIAAVKSLPSAKFKQSYEFIMNLRDLDLKKPEEQIELWVTLPHGKGKKVTIGALVGPEMAESAKANFDVVVVHDNFPRFAQDKKGVKKLARTNDFFIAQANIMADIAKTFGRVFGPRGKMPNPKAGCVVPPNANLKVLADRLRKTIKVAAKTQPSIKVMVGTQEMSDDQVADNIMAVYSNVMQKLPQESSNIKSVLLKLSMSAPVKITEAGVVKPTIKAETAPEAKKAKSAKAEEKTDAAEKPAKPKKAKKEAAQ